MWQFYGTGVERVGRVGDGLVPVLPSNLLLCEVKANYF